MSSIPASALVNVIPSVLSAGGSSLDMNGLILTTSTRAPLGVVLSFSNKDDVADYFGGSSDEAAAAVIYFKGFDNSFIKPGALLFAQYNQSAVAAYLRGADVSSLTLANLQALNGLISIVSDGTTHAATVSLAAASSFSNAAALIQTGLNAGVAFTGVIAANVVTGTINPNAVTGSIAGTTLTVSAVATGVLAAGQTISGSGIAAGTTIVAQLTGTAGSTGTYQVSVSQTVGSTSITASGGGLTVSAVVSGTLAVGQTLTGSGVTTGTTITALGTGTGGTGTYAVNDSQTVGSESITANGGTLTASAVTGTLAVGDVIAGAGVTLGNHITAAITGTGGSGTYFVSVGDTVGSEAMTVSGAGVAVTFDSVSGGFKIASGITGAASTMSFASGALATSLSLTEVTGAVLSQGAAGTTPSTFMNAVLDQSKNWAQFMTLFNPDASGNANKQLFAAWTNGQDNQYGYIAWDTDVTPTLSSAATSSLGNILQTANSSGTVCIYAPDYTLAAFALGYPASLDFTRTNGRTTIAYRGQTGFEPNVTNETVGDNLIANGYNFYGGYATRNQAFIEFQPGKISGPYLWADTYFNEIWLTNAFQLALMTFLQNTPSVPYNTAGYDLIRNACLDPINQAGNFGIWRKGVTLSSAQAAEVNSQAGVDIANTLSTQGWYLQIRDALPIVRQARTSPPMTFWYMDGGSVQKLTLASVAVQ